MCVCVWIWSLFLMHQGPERMATSRIIERIFICYIFFLYCIYSDSFQGDLSKTVSQSQTERRTVHRWTQEHVCFFNDSAHFWNKHTRTQSRWGERSGAWAQVNVTRSPDHLGNLPTTNKVWLWNRLPNPPPFPRRRCQFPCCWHCWVFRSAGAIDRAGWQL